MDIIHDQSKHKFYCIVDGQECLAVYSVDKNILDFNHTYTPPGLRGRGIAKTIYKKVAAYLEENKFKANASCSYAEKFFSEEKYRKYLAGK